MRTLDDEKNSASSVSVRSKAKFPIKAVYGGCEGKTTSSRIRRSAAMKD